MIRRLLIVLFALWAPLAAAQTVPFPGPPLANTITGTGASGRCALFGGTTSITSDTGCTYAGTGLTFALSLGGSLSSQNTGPTGFVITSNTAASGATDTGFALAVVGNLGAADLPLVVSDGGGTLLSLSGTGALSAGPITCGSSSQLCTFTAPSTAAQGLTIETNTTPTGAGAVGVKISESGDMADADFPFVVSDSGGTLLTVNGVGDISISANLIVTGDGDAVRFTASNDISAGDDVIATDDVNVGDDLLFGGTTEASSAIGPVAAVAGKAQGIIIQPGDGVAAVFADLGAATNGAMIYCSNCQPTSAFVNSTCITGGTGAYAIRLNGVWKCTQ